MNIWLKHIKEMKTILLYIAVSFLLTFCFSLRKFHILLYALACPILNLDVTLKNSRDFICTDFYEFMITYFYVALFFSIYLTILLGVKMIINYCKSGLFHSEIVRLSFGFRFLIFVVFFSDFVIWFLVLPLIFSFFLKLEKNLTTITIQLEAKIFDYVNVIFSLIILFNLVFPLLFFIILFLYRNSLNLQFFFKNRRSLLLIFVFLGCIFSPPDVLVQIIIAGALMGYAELLFLLSFVKMQYNKFL